MHLFIKLNLIPYRKNVEQRTTAVLRQNDSVYWTASSKFLYFDIGISVSYFWLVILQRQRRIKNRVKRLS